jgi:hypothetical protein
MMSAYEDANAVLPVISLQGTDDRIGRTITATPSNEASLDSKLDGIGVGRGGHFD